MLEPLQAEFLLMTASFRKEIANVVRDINKVGAALNSLGAGSTGLEKSIANVGKVGAATKSATNATVAHNAALAQQAALIDSNTARHKQQADGIKRQNQELQNAGKHFGAADVQARGLLGTIGSMLGRIALFSIAAGLVVRAFFSIASAIKNAAAEGLHFNAVMEEGQIAIAGVLASSRQVADESGKIIGPLEAYPFLLEQAAKIQKEIFIANIKTLGTAEELQGVYLQILASTKGQVEAQGDLLKASMIVTNIGKINGQNGERLTAEARQTFTVESQIGQTVLRTLGIRFQTAKVLRDQGLLLKEIVTRGAVWLQLSDKLSVTWEALGSSVSSFFSITTASAFEETFNGLKEVMKGVTDEFQKMSAKGGLTAALNLTPQQLNELGRLLGKLTLDFTVGLAKVTNALIEFTSAVREAIKQFTADLSEAARNLDALFLHIPSAITIAINFLPSLSDLARNITDFINTLPGRDPRKQVADAAALDLLAKGFKANQEQAAEGFKKLTGATNENEKAGTEWRKGWTLIPGILDKTADSGKAAEKAARQLADAMDKLAASQLRYQEQLAKASSDPAVLIELQRLRLKNIETGLQEELLKVKKNTAAITALKAAAEVERAIAQAQGVEDQIRGIERAAELYRKEADFAHESAQARIQATNAVREAEIAGLQQQLSLAQERSGAYTEQIELIRKIGELQIATARDNVLAIQQEIAARQTYISTLQQQQAAALAQANQATNDLARAEALNRILALMQLIDAETLKQIQSSGQLAVATAKVGQAGVDAAQNMRKATTVTVNFGTEIKRTIDDIFDAMIAGTLDAGDALKSFGLGIGRAFVGGFTDALAAKLKFDVDFKKNIGGLSGILDTFASGIDSTFKGLFDLLGGDLGDFKTSAADLFDAFEDFDFSKISKGFGDMWASIGTGGQLLAANFGADFFIDAFKLNKSDEAKVGALVGEGIGTAIGAYFGAPAVGAAIGKVLGAFLGGLFVSTPTAGTEIRQGVVAYLQELEVSFSDEIKSGKYGFGWIEEYRKANNLGFLEASKEFIPQNFAAVVAAGLDKQLLALGLVITSKAAGKLKKDLNQTGVTFANMITENLAGDPKKIQGFIDDLVQKGKFSLLNMIGSLNEAFKEGRIEADLYNKAIEGTVALFLKDFPKALDIKKIIASSMVDGLLDVDKFQEQIEIIVAEFEGLKKVIGDTIQGGIDAAASGKPLSIEKFAKAFGDQLKEVLRNAIVSAVTEGIAGLLTSGVLGGVLAEITKLAADLGQGKISKEDFSTKIKELAAKAKPEIERLAEAFGPLGKFVLDLLRDLGLLPGAIAKVAAATDVIDFSQFGASLIDDIKNQMAKSGDIVPADLLSNLRLDISAAISDAFVTGVTEEMIQPWIDKIGKQFSGSIQKAMKDGVVTADEMDAILAKVGGNFEKIPKEVKAGLDLLDEWTSSPAYQKIREMFRAREMLAGFEESVAGVGKALVDGIKGQLATIGSIVPQGLLDDLQLDISMAISDAFLSGVVETMIQPWIDGIAKQFSSGMKNALKDGVLTAGEMDKILAKAGRNFERIPLDVKAAFHFIDKWTSSPAYKKIQNLFQAREMTKSFQDSVKGIGKSLVDEIKKQIRETGSLDAGNLAESLKGQIGDAIASAIIDSVVQLAIIGPILQVALAPFNTAFREAMADGVISAAEMAALLALGSSAMAAVPGFIAAGVELLKSFLPGLKDLLGSLPRGGGGGGGGGSAGTRTDRVDVPFAEAERARRQAQREVREAVRALAETFNDAADTLVESFEDIQAKLEGAIYELQASLRNASGFGNAFQQLLEDLRSQGIEIEGIQDLLDIDKLLEGTTGLLRQYAIRAIEYFKQALRAMGLSFEEIIGLIAKLQKDAEKARKKAIEDLLEPVREFIDGSDSDALTDLFNEFKELQDRIQKNAVELRRNGVDVTKLLDDLAKAMKKNLAQAIKDLIGDFLDEGDSNALTDLFNRYKELVDQIQKNAAELRKNGVDVEKILDDLAKAMKKNLVKAIRDLIGDFLDTSDADALADLFSRFRDIEDQIKRNAAELKKNGIDVAKILDDLAKALARNIAKLRKELTDPIADAINNIKPAAIKPLADFLTDIGKVKKLDDLTRIRDLAIDAIRRTLEIQIEAAQKASDARIAQFQKEHDAEVKILEKRKTGLERLQQLRQQQLTEEVQRISQMRETAKSLFQAADDLKLSNVSPLKPIQRLNEAQRKFNEDLRKAQGGDIEAAKRLPQLAQQLLAEARTVFASSPQFTAIFEMIQTALRSVGQDLIEQASIAERQLGKLNNLETIEQEIARLTRELGLKGNESLAELERLQREVDRNITEVNRELQKLIRQEQRLLRETIERYQNLAIARLRILQAALEAKFDQLIAALLRENETAPDLQPPPPPVRPGNVRQDMQLQISYEDLAEAIVGAFDEREQIISVPIQVVTTDGSVIANTVIRRLTTDTSRGKIVVDARGSGRTGVF